jgi:hypothetical protein
MQHHENLKFQDVTLRSLTVIPFLFVGMALL